MNEITLTGSVELQAAADGKLPSFTMLAYSGDVMSVGGYGSIVIDAKGLDIPGRSVPVLKDHDLEKIVGHGNATVDKRTGEIAANGVVSGVGPAAQEVVNLAKNGFAWQASVGASVLKSEYVESGQSVKVNGRTVQGPVTVIRKSSLREISFVSIGADSATSVSVAAADKSSKVKGRTMNEFEKFAADMGFDPAALTDQQTAALRAGYDAERAKAKAASGANARAIHEMCSRFAKSAPQHAETIFAMGAEGIENAIDFDRLEAMVTLKLLQAHGSGPNTNLPSGNRPAHANIIEASLLAGLGLPEKSIAKHFGDNVTNEAIKASNRGLGLQGLLRATLKAAGMHVPSGKLGDAAIRDAFVASNRLEASVGTSTISIPGILSNVANKLLLESFTNTNVVWSKFCRVGSNSDFKASTRYRMTGLGVFEEVAAAGELKHVSLGEASSTAQLATYGALVGISRRDLINDDLGSFAAIPRALGRMSAIAIEKAVFTLLLANTGTFFGTGNANYESGAGSALGTTGLAAALSRFRSQTDQNGDPTYLSPQVLLVPPALESTALSLMNSTENVVAGDSDVEKPSGNSFRGLAETVVAPFLGTAAALTGASNAGWYLTVGPSDFSIIEVATLNGQVMPTIETGSLNFDQLGFATRAYHDFGVSQLEHRGGVFSAGS